MLYVFGDSWGYGSELTVSERPFAYSLSILLETDFLNYSQEGMSLGHITARVLSKIEKITSNDYVVVIVPPDVRWYHIDDEFEFESLSIDNSTYKAELQNYTLPWFIYHHSLFIYTICCALATKTNKFVLAHNYGKLIIDDRFATLINKDCFLSEKSLTDLLTGDTWELNYSLEHDGPSSSVFTGKYFEGKICHPNGLGHIQIAKLLYKTLII